MEEHKILKLENGDIHYWVNKNSNMCLFFFSWCNSRS